MKSYNGSGRKSYGQELTDYLKEIKKIPLLTPEQERALAYRIRNGDRNALKELVESNYRFVVSQAKRYSWSDAPIMDIIQEGNTALIRAAETFNPDLGLRFISYAVWWIKKYMFHYLSRAESPIAIPERKAHVVFKINRVKEQLYQKLKREPTIEELAAELNLPVGKVAQFSKLAEKPVSYESFMSYYESKSGEEPDFSSEAQKSEKTSAVSKLLSRLKEKERASVEMYFGFNGQEKMSYEKIGKAVNLSREGARRTVQRGIEKLRLDPESKLLATYLFEDYS